VNGVHENNTQCAIYHDYNWAFNFSCSWDQPNGHAYCYNVSLEFDYYADYNSINVVNITCSNGDQKVLYQDGLELVVEPSVVEFLHSNVYEDGSLSITFDDLENIHNLTMVLVEQVDFDLVTVPGSCVNITEDTTYDLDNNLMHFYYSFVPQKNYRITFEVMHGKFIDKFTHLLSIPLIKAVSRKKYFTVASEDLVDSMYGLDLVVDIMESVNTTYTYHWDCFGMTNVTQENSLGVDTLTLAKQCYTVNMNVTSNRMLSTLTNRSICTEVGVNTTINFKYGIALGTTSYFDVNAFEVGTDTCFAVDIGGVYFVNDVAKCNIHLPEITSSTLFTQIANPPVSTIMASSRLFDDIGDYDIEFMAVNSVHLQREKYIHSILNLTCESPELTIKGMISLKN